MKDLSHAGKDLKNQLTAGLNQFSAELISKEGLAQTGNSPVRTGFFASSWKAQTKRVQAEDQIEKFKPWSEKAKEQGKIQPVIKPRFKAESDLKLQDTVYVGSSVEYAERAIEFGQVQNYVQGQGIKALLRKNFSEKGGRS
jgi:hypothetical protein|tara:strand:- start:419 stop:841 length:423 start_codon:yes stop_codon:yes gene_type:complete